MNDLIIPRLDALSAPLIDAEQKAQMSFKNFRPELCKLWRSECKSI